MINLLIAIAFAIAAWLVPVAVGWPWWTGALPALIVLVLAMFLLSQRTARLVQADMEPVTAVFAGLQSVRTQDELKSKLAEARALMEAVKARHGRWQLYLDRQIDAQIGMLDYMTLDFDAALPRLENSFRDWTSKVAAGCVHVRRDRLDRAWKCFEEAAGYAPKEPTVYLVWGTLKERKGNRDDALVVFAKGLEAVPEHALLKQLKNTVANKQRIDVERLGEIWQRFFPEEAAQKMMVRGARGGPQLPPGVTPRMVQGYPQTRARGKLARRR